MSGEIHQTFQLSERGLKIIIDHNCIKFLLSGELSASAIQTFLDGLFRLGSATANAPLEFLKTRWCEKDLKSLRKTTAHLTRPFQLDFQQNRRAGIQPLHHRLPGGSITVTRKFSPLQQPPLSHEIIKRRTRMKKVLNPVLFTIPR